MPLKGDSIMNLSIFAVAITVTTLLINLGSGHDSLIGPDGEQLGQMSCAQKVQDIEKRLNEIEQEYEQLVQYYLGAERQYNPQAMLENALYQTEAAFLLSFVPNPKIGPGEGIEIPIKEVNSIAGIPGKAGIFKDTINALKWNGGEREKYRTRIYDMIGIINATKQEYENAMHDCNSINQ
jgi:hypothetical protein